MDVLKFGAPENLESHKTKKDFIDSLSKKFPSIIAYHYNSSADEGLYVEMDKSIKEKYLRWLISSGFDGNSVAIATISVYNSKKYKKLIKNKKAP